VWIADEAGEIGDIYEVMVERDIASEWIGERLAGSDSLAGKRGIDELGQHVHAGAGAANGNVARDESVEVVFDRSALPEIDVVGLVASGNPESFSVLDGGDNEGVIGGRAIGIIRVATEFSFGQSC
jgi:hypothetical protein